MYLLAGPLNQQANPGKGQVAVLLQLTENRSYRCCSNQDKTSALQRVELELVSQCSDAQTLQL